MLGFVYVLEFMLMYVYVFMLVFVLMDMDMDMVMDTCKKKNFITCKLISGNLKFM
jgi:hypothetical protein